MARPELPDIDAGLEAWDALLEQWKDILTDGPFPIKFYATVSALPAAGADNLNCLAVTLDTKELWHSDGTAWRIVGGGTGHVDASGARAELKKATTLLSPLAGATATWTGAFPAGVHALGVSARVTTLVTSGDGGTSFNVGDGTDADRYAATVAFAVGTTKTPADATADPSGWRAAAGNVVLTCVGGTFSAGAVRLVAYYLQLTAPTS
jgi:hypothetical protein